MIFLWVVIGVLGCTTAASIIFNSIQRNKIIEFQNLLKTMQEKEIKIIEINKKIQDQKEQEEKELYELQQKKEWLDNYIKQGYDDTDKFIKKYQETKKNEINAQLEKYQENENFKLEQYKNKIIEEQKTLNNTILKLQEEINFNKDKLDRIVSSIQSLREANKRELERQSSSTFYNIQISEGAKNAIQQIENILPFIDIENRETVYKIIWANYYKNPTAELFSRLKLNKECCGIYKITNKKDNKVYIGQSVNIEDRLRNHIKAGLGINSSNNKLYTAMKKDRIENFSFEVIELCEKNRLNERERYYIQVYNSVEDGYNSTIGNKG